MGNGESRFLQNRPNPNERERTRPILFYTREGCFLCEEFELLLLESLAPRNLRFERIDIDREPAAKSRFGTRIPVLEIGAQIVAEGRIGPEGLEEKLNEFFGEKSPSERCSRKKPVIP